MFEVLHKDMSRNVWMRVMVMVKIRMTTSRAWEWKACYAGWAMGIKLQGKSHWCAEVWKPSGSPVGYNGSTRIAFTRTSSL